MVAATKLFCTNMSDTEFLPDNAITQIERQEAEMLMRKEQAEREYDRKVNNAIVAEKKAKRQAQLQKIRDRRRNAHIRFFIHVASNALFIWMGYLMVLNLLRWVIIRIL